MHAENRHQVHTRRKGSRLSLTIRCTLCCAYSDGAWATQVASRFRREFLMTLPPRRLVQSAPLAQPRRRVLFYPLWPLFPGKKGPGKLALIEDGGETVFGRQVIARRFQKAPEWPSPGQQSTAYAVYLRWVSKSPRTSRLAPIFDM